MRAPLTLAPQAVGILISDIASLVVAADDEAGLRVWSLEDASTALTIHTPQTNAIAELLPGKVFISSLLVLPLFSGSDPPVSL